MLRNIIGPVFNFKNVFLLFLRVFQNSSSFCRENEIFKIKKQKKDQFLTLKRAKIGPFLLYSAYIYICMHAVELTTGPRFGRL